MKPSRTLRLTLPTALAALVLAVAGAMSTASATTYWTFMNDYEGNCLVSSTVSDKVWSDSCNDSLDTRNWYYGAESVTNVDGQVFRRLVSRANGDCLTTDNKTNANAVWMSPCGSAGGQFWSNDYHVLENFNGNLLRTSANGDAVYTTSQYVADPDIEPARYTWWGSHS
ncbi:hypothetical protein ACWDSD_21650 [Streptomyces spiralis]